MSRKYKDSKEVPTQVLSDRLKVLTHFVTEGPKRVEREFVMRIPAEVDHDADLVLSEAGRRLLALGLQVEQLEKRACNGLCSENLSAYAQQVEQLQAENTELKERNNMLEVYVDNSGPKYVQKSEYETKLAQIKELEAALEKKVCGKCFGLS